MGELVSGYQLRRVKGVENAVVVVVAGFCRKARDDASSRKIVLRVVVLLILLLLSSSPFALRYVYWGEYPLSFAACLGQEESYRLMLARGADPNNQDTNGNTVLHMLVIYEKIVITP